MSKIDIDKWVTSMYKLYKKCGETMPRPMFFALLDQYLTITEDGELVEREPKKISFKDNKEFNYNAGIAKMSDKFLRHVEPNSHSLRNYKSISNEIHTANVIDIITDIDVDKMVEDKFQSIDGAYNCKEWYLRGIEDALEEIKKNSK